MRTYTTLPVGFRGRKFELWTYAVSHRQLLLRSNKSEEYPTRCEILFTNVSHLKIPAWIDALEIEVGDHSTALEAEETSLLKESGTVLYLIRGRGFSGYVLAGNLTYVEDNGEYYEPSSLLLGSVSDNAGDETNSA